MSLDFIPAELSDATEISAILEEWYRVNSWLPQVHDSQERAGYGRLLLTHSEVTMFRWRGLCVGFIALGKDIVDSLYVRSKFQRQGFGGATAMRKPKGTSLGSGCLNVTGEPSVVTLAWALR